MSIEAMKLALAALETCRIRSVSEWSVEDITPKNVTAAIAAIRTAIQQAEAKQPTTAIACGIPGMAKTTCPYCEQGFAFEHEQPATGEPVQADSSEHLRVIASLGDALRRLSFAAQTTGGTAGLDAELQSAIGQAEQALSLGGIWQAMSATPEPVVDVRCEGCGYMTHHREHMGCVRAAKQHIHPAPSEPDDVARDAERYRFIRDADVSDDLIPDIALYAMESLDEYIDAAILAAKKPSA